MIEYTEWFPPCVKPVRDGLYFIKYGAASDCWHVAFLNDDRWYSAGVAADGRPKTEAYRLGTEPCYWWRGLTHNAGG